MLDAIGADGTLAGGCALTYAVFRVAVEVMEALRTQLQQAEQLSRERVAAQAPRGRGTRRLSEREARATAPPHDETFFLLLRLETISTLLYSSASSDVYIIQLDPRLLKIPKTLSVIRISQPNRRA